MKYTFRKYFAFALLVVLNAAFTALYACPSCKEAYGAGTKEAAIGESYSMSVVFFLGMFFSILIGGTGFITWQIKKHSKLGSM